VVAQVSLPEINLVPVPETAVTAEHPTALLAAQMELLEDLTE
jgi:hypothetical protein